MARHGLSSPQAPKFDPSSITPDRLRPPSHFPQELADAAAAAAAAAARRDGGGGGLWGGSFGSDEELFAAAQLETEDLHRSHSMPHLSVGSLLDDMDGKGAGSQASQTTETSTVSTRKDDAGNKFVNQYMIIHKLGQGSYGKVKLCINSVNGKPYAIKVVQKEHLKNVKSGSGTALQLIFTEIAVMKKMDHPNVVRLLEVMDSPDSKKLFMVMEYVSRGPVMRTTSRAGRPMIE